jgi:hypothetical protein
VGLPTVDHVFFIPAVLLVGIAIGYVLGARAARAEMKRRAAERKK